MQEDLVPLDLPSGFVNNGTTYQSKNRWFTGNLVRFFQKTIQPIGGWTQRTTTGATISGTPNAAHAWQDNAGNSWLAIGTTSGLYVVSSSNVVYDITLAGLVGGTPYTWQLDNFGSYLIAAYNLTTYNALYSLNVLIWGGNTAATAQQAFTGSAGPNTTYGVHATHDRFFVCLRGSDPNTTSYIRPGGATY